MRFRSLTLNIVGCLIVVALAVGISIGAILYRAAIEKAESNIADVALVLSTLIDSKAEMDLVFYPGQDIGTGFGTTKSMIRDAFADLTGGISTLGVHFVVPDGANFKVLISRIPAGEAAPPDLIDRGTSFGRILTRAFRGDTGPDRITNAVGQDVLVAVAPVPTLKSAVVVETTLSQVEAPFTRAALFGLMVGILVVTFGAAYTLSQTRQVVQISTEANTKLASVQAEGARASDQLRAALESSTEGFALFDSDDRLVICNKVFRDDYEKTGTPLVTGVTFAEMLRARAAAGAYTDLGDDVEASIQQRLEHHRNPSAPLERLMRDGRWLQISEHRTQDGGTICIWTNITELKRKELELRESQQRFRDFTRTASDWVWETDADERFTMLTTGIDSDAPVDLAAVLGKTRWDVAAEDTSTAKWSAHRRAIQAREPFREFEYRFATAKGRSGVASVSGLPVFDDEGNFRGYRGTATDITELRAQEERLWALEERFRAAFTSVTVGIVLADVHGTILDVNPAASHIFGIEPEEAIGANVSSLMPSPDRVRHDSYIRNYLETGQRKIIGIGREVTGLRKNGETFPMYLGIAEIKLRGQRQFIASINDLSSTRMLEQQLRQAQKMETVGQMVGGIAHDFNNLLGIIIGNLDLARRKIEDGTPLYRQIEKAMGAADRGATLTRRLLNFSRSAPTASEAVDVNAAILGVHDMIQRSLTKTIEVRMTLADDLPPVLVDPGDLDDSLINLAVNARDAMPTGGILKMDTGLIDVDSSNDLTKSDLTPGAYVVIEVTDTGSGIAREHMAYIFDPFYSTKEKDKGTGLGLSMVYGFARRSKGCVTVYSEVGLGTTFRIYLPVADKEVAVRDRRSPDQVRELLGGTEAVLVVDDEADLAEVAAANLQELGYTTMIAHSGAEALQVLEGADHIDLMLTDVIMPGGMNGFDLAETAARLHPDLKICLASGFTGEMVAGKDSRAAEYPLLRKPYNHRDLAAHIRRILDAAD